MGIRLLTEADSPAYAAFRQEMWPTHTGAGSWETVHLKYVRNPHAALCPGSGLYAYFQGDSIYGIMGAYPMPITLDGSLFPGHMLVDWAVLPRYQLTPIAGKLWQVLQSLPGRKFGSCGTRASQGVLERRAVRIPAIVSRVLVRPVGALLLRAFHLAPFAQPSPACVEELLPKGCGVEVCSAAEASMGEPEQWQRTALVHRGPDFWDAYCSRRNQNGAISLRVTSNAARAYVILQLRDIGRFRTASLLSLRLQPATVSCAQEAGRPLNRALRKLNVCSLDATSTATDKCRQYFLRSAGIRVVQAATHWWAVPTPSDTFAVQDVRWSLTYADRDSHWSYVQPTNPGCSSQQLPQKEM